MKEKYGKKKNEDFGGAAGEEALNQRREGERGKSISTSGTRKETGTYGVTIIMHMHFMRVILTYSLIYYIYIYISIFLFATLIIKY